LPILRYLDLIVCNRMSQHPDLARAIAFCEKHNLRVPILMAPMASACPASLAIAVANAGGIGGCGGLVMQPDAIHKWTTDVRAKTNGGFQINLWIPDPPPKRDPAAEDAVRRFLNDWGPEVPAEAADVTPPNFDAQCEALLEAGPAIISSIMGVFPGQFVARMKSKGIKWLATVTTVNEAKAAESAGADILVAQGMRLDEQHRRTPWSAPSSRDVRRVASPTPTREPQHLRVLRPRRRTLCNVD
jgi:nitronate monooxygenase